MNGARIGLCSQGNSSWLSIGSCSCSESRFGYLGCRVLGNWLPLLFCRDGLPDPGVLKPDEGSQLERDSVTLLACFICCSQKCSALRADSTSNTMRTRRVIVRVVQSNTCVMCSAAWAKFSGVGACWPEVAANTVFKRVTAVLNQFELFVDGSSANQCLAAMSLCVAQALGRVDLRPVDVISA